MATERDEFHDSSSNQPIKGPPQIPLQAQIAVNPGVELHKVSVKVPPFYAEKPALWFAQLESQFSLADITRDTTKYHLTLSQLDPIYAAEVEDIITAPHAADKYERLKRELIKRLSASREKKVKQLLTHEELGDRKPSQFLRHLSQLAGPGVPEEFIRTIWTSRLPSSTQSIIAAQTKSNLDEVAELADRIHDVVSPNFQVAATQAGPSHRPSSGESSQIAELTRQVAMLADKLEQMSRSRSRSRQRSNSFSRNRGRSPSSRSDSNYRRYPLCWYHAKHGERAKKCVKPCDFKGNGQGNQ